MPGHKRPTPNIRRQMWIKSEKVIHKSHILNSLPLRSDVAMEIWKKKATRMLQCSTITIRSFLKNAAFLIQDSAVNWVTVSSSVWTDILQCPFDISRWEFCSGLSVQLLNGTGWDDEIFLIEGFGVKSALFSSLTLLSEDELSLDFVFAHWNELLASNKILYS